VSPSNILDEWGADYRVPPSNLVEESRFSLSATLDSSEWEGGCFPGAIIDSSRGQGGSFLSASSIYIEDKESVLCASIKFEERKYVSSVPSSTFLEHKKAVT
jgi:hypothetical protein